MMILERSFNAVSANRDMTNNARWLLIDYHCVGSPLYTSHTWALSRTAQFIMEQQKR